MHKLGPNERRNCSKIIKEWQYFLRAETKATEAVHSQLMCFSSAAAGEKGRGVGSREMGNQNKPFHVVGSVWGQGKEDTCEEQKNEAFAGIER